MAWPRSWRVQFNDPKNHITKCDFDGFFVPSSSRCIHMTTQIHDPRYEPLIGCEIHVNPMYEWRRRKHTPLGLMILDGDENFWWFYKTPMVYRRGDARPILWTLMRPARGLVFSALDKERIKMEIDRALAQAGV